ncbi:unnamed protein product [Caenorhabditis auriculariae]|uniref:Translocon-associated protein subunit beta n=1 Tax=Caenorhabditis auriculariae TaxID=2777116 RepID=A0A8S1HGN2_9PELO|nr:unnamed protein product [Caenorhabditis auriculariae]
MANNFLGHHLFQFLVLSCFFFMAVAATKPRLLVEKTHLSTISVQGKPTAVEYKVYNVGDAEATHIFLDDRSSFPTQEFTIEKGFLYVQFPKIAAKSNLTHVVVVKPNKMGSFEDKPARLTFTDPKTGVPEVVYSTSMGKVSVYRQKEYNYVFGSKAEHFLKFALIVAPLTFVPLGFAIRSKNRYTLVKKSY